MRMLPIVRGWESGLPENFMTAGCGRLVEKARESYENGSSQDWRKLLGDDAGRSFSSSSLWKTYICPNCGDVI
jgi:hypothetical protein